MNWYMKIKEKGSAYGQYSSQAKAFVINVIGEEDQATGIRTLYPVEKQVKEVYDLSGRRLNAPKRGQVNPKPFTPSSSVEISNGTNKLFHTLG